jgi:hypothetical protein
MAPESRAHNPSDDSVILMSKAPDNPAEKKEWAHHVMRLQIAMWLPAHCAVCKREYESVDDFLARNPRAGRGWDREPTDWDDAFVDDACFGSYGVGG